MLQIIGIICLALVLPGQGTPSFGFVSVGYKTLTEGSNLGLLCNVHNLTDDYSISWYRKTVTGERTVICRNGMLINNDLEREAEAYKNPRLFYVEIHQVRGRDLGYLINGNNYTCEVTLKRTGEAVLVSSGLILKALYSPSFLYPICGTCRFSSDLIGSNVTISCFSEPGQPNIALKWLRNGEKIGNLQTIMKHSLLYLEYTFILRAQDLESNYSCTNVVQSCKLTLDSDKTCAEESSPTMLLDTDTSQSPGTVIVPTWKNSSMVPTNEISADSLMQTSNITVIGASIGAVLFIVFCLLTGICLYKRKAQQRPHITHLAKQQCKKTSTGEAIKPPQVPEQGVDYINVKQSTDNRDLETYADLNPREEANYSILQNTQHKENNQNLEMMTTVQDPAPDYINIKQSTANHMV